MDSENLNLFEDGELVAGVKDYSTREVELWLMMSLKDFIPEDMHSMYINEGNVLFAFGDVEGCEFDFKNQCDCVFEMTNGGKRSVLSSFDTVTYFTNLTYRNESQRRRVSLDFLTDPAFLRVIEPKTGKFILSNLIRCASQQHKALKSYVDYVKNNIFSFPLLEELNRFALSQKIAYKSARQKLWFIMKLAEELKLVEITKGFKKFVETHPGEINRTLLDHTITLKYLSPAQPHSVSEVYQDNSVTQLDSVNPVNFVDNLKSTIDSIDIVKQTVDLNDYSMDIVNNIDDLVDHSHSYSMPDLSSSVSSSSRNPIGFTSLHIGEMSTPVRKDAQFREKQIDSFDSNFMKLIEQESTPLIEFESSVDGSKSVSNTLNSSQPSVIGQFVQRGLDRFVKKKQSFAFKNAVSTVSILEAACKLYGKGPKWSNPNRKEFDLANKSKKLVYIKPIKTIGQNDLAYQYLMQYASVHQKLNGGVRQEHAVSYGIIELKRASPNETYNSYTLNTEPWKDERFEKKWLRLSNAIHFTPWFISTQSNKLHPVEPYQLDTQPTQPTKPDELDKLNESVEYDQKGELQAVKLDELDETDKRREAVKLDESTKPNEVVEYEHKDQLDQVVKLDVLDEGAELDKMVKKERVEPKGFDKLDVNESITLTTTDVESQDQDAMPPYNPTPHSEQLKHEQPDKSVNPSEGVKGVEKQMKLTELFKYVYDKISKAKQLPECPELMLVSKNRAEVKRELEKFTQMDSETVLLAKKRRVLDDEFLEPMPENYVRIPKPSNTEHPDTEPTNNVKLDDSVDHNKSVKLGDSVAQDKPNDNVNKGARVQNKLSKRERLKRMREIMKSMIEFEAEESEDEYLSDPEEIKRSLQLLRERLMNPSESESESESEAEIAREMSGFIEEVELNEEDEEIARQRFYEDLRLQEEAELKRLMSFKEKGEKELTRREERLKLLMKLKNAKKHDEFHLSDFESSDDERDIHRKHRVKVTRDDLDKLLRFKYQDTVLSKDQHLEQFIDYKLSEANITIPIAEKVPVFTNFVEVPKQTQEIGSANQIKNRRDMVDNMFNEGFDSIFSNIEQYKSDSSLTVNPFGTPNRTMDNSSSKSPKRPTLLMKSFRWDHSQAKPGNSTTIRYILI